MKLNCWYPLEATDKRLSFAMLILRVVSGAGMAMHGLPKFQNMTGWMGPDATIPVVFIILAALAEFLGGIALALGVLTPFASFGIASTMTVAAAFHIGQGDPWVGKGGPSWELASIYLVISIFFLLVGPGKLSLDAIITKKFRS